MKARRKSDGEIISVETIVYNAKNGERYSPSELDFNVDAEETVIQGWVAVDDNGDLFLYRTKPARDEVSGMWMSGECPLDVGINLFPDLTWSSDPIECEITIKRKKE